MKKRLLIFGKVQGVGFRYWLYEKAIKKNIRGWVKNTIQGQVEALLIGNDKDVNEAKAMGITDFNKKYELNEIVKGDSIFCATGITSSDVLTGIKIVNENYTSETLATHKSSGFKKVIKNTTVIKE